MSTIQIIEKVNNLERQIETIKWMLTSLPHSTGQKSIVKATSGILGRDFPSGITYENRIRKSWSKRFLQNK